MSVWEDVEAECSPSRMADPSPANTPSASVGEVAGSAIPVIPGGENRWFVESKSRPGSWWLIERRLVPYLHTEQWETDCGCEWSKSQLDKPRPERIACRHLKALVKYQNALNRRPVSPPHPGMWE